jgi:hypothetical protein
MLKTPASRLYPENVLALIREQFFKLTRRNAELHDELLLRLRDQLEQNSQFLYAWVKGLLDTAREGEPNKTRLERLANRLKEREEANWAWEDEELCALLGTEVSDSLPTLAGFSLMRVSQHYREIYYADIISDILPERTLALIKNSVSVPAINDAWGGSAGEVIRWDGSVRRTIQWAGSVGEAIRRREEYCVPNSFLDPKGVVAAEDLIGGNISILMCPVYAMEDSKEVIAVVFCFFPLPNIFVKKSLVFSEAVNGHTPIIAHFCMAKDSSSSNERLMNVIQQYYVGGKKGVTERELLKALVTDDTQNNPVGAVLGLCCTIDKDNNAVVKSVVTCERFLERQGWLPEFLKLHGNELSIELSGEVHNWGKLTLILRNPIEPDAFLCAIPTYLVDPLKYLWKVFEGCDFKVDLNDFPDSVSPRWEKEAKPVERTKIAADMIVALTSQIVYFLDAVLSGEETAGEADQYLENIHQILSLEEVYENAYFKSSPGWNTERYERNLRDWARKLHRVTGSSCIAVVGQITDVDNLDPNANARILWRSKTAFARVNFQNWDQWLADRFSLNDRLVSSDSLRRVDDLVFRQLPGFNEAFARSLNIEFQYPVPLSPDSAGNPRGFFRLCSLAPIKSEDSNPVVQLVSAFYSVILMERSKAEAETQATLAKYARGASHGLKNALAVPSLVLGTPTADPGSRSMDNLARRMIEALNRDPTSIDRAKVRELANAADFVLQEVSYLKQQAELFFWVMDQGRAKKDISERRLEVVKKPLRMVLGLSFLRGLYLSFRLRLTPQELLPVLRPGLGGSTTIEGLREFIGNELIRAERGGVLEDTLDAVLWEIQQKTRLRLAFPDNVPGELSGLSVLLADAVLMELCQNATKGALLSVDGSEKEPFVEIGVDEAANGIRITIRNSAKPSDIDKLEVAGREETEGRGGPGTAGSGGIQGIWQIRMLCNTLGEGRVKLQSPPYSRDQTGEFVVTVIPVSDFPNAGQST